VTFYGQLLGKLGDRVYGVVLHEPGHYVCLRKLSTGEFIAVNSTEQAVGANGVFELNSICLI
jgi:hypothetical protein